MEAQSCPYRSASVDASSMSCPARWEIPGKLGLAELPRTDDQISQRTLPQFVVSVQGMVLTLPYGVDTVIHSEAPRGIHLNRRPACWSLGTSVDHKHLVDFVEDVFGCLILIG